MNSPPACLPVKHAASDIYSHPITPLITFLKLSSLISSLFRYCQPPTNPRPRSQNQALLLLGLVGEKGGARGVLEDFADAVVGFGGTFQVFVGADLLADILGL